MRVFFKSGAKIVSLKSEGLTLLYYKDLGLYYVRKYFIPPRTEHNTLMGSIFKVLSNIWKAAPDEFKDQFTIYAEHYNKHKVDKYPINGYACFTKLMFEFRKENPDIDLAEMNWEDILFGVFNRDIQDAQDGETIINYELLIMNEGKKRYILDSQLEECSLGRDVWHTKSANI